MGNGPSRVEADTAVEPRTVDRTLRHERLPRDERPAREDPYLAEPRAPRERQRGGACCDDTDDERPVDSHRTNDTARGDEGDGAAAEAGRDARVDAAGRDHPCRPFHRQRPSQQGGQIAVALPARRAAENGRVEVEPVAPYVGRSEEHTSELQS